MSVADICELGSLLQGDNNEKAELDRQIISVEAAIEQQEARVSNIHFIIKCIFTGNLIQDGIFFHCESYM